MVTLQALALTLTVTGAGQTVLLDFYGDYCPPCRQMMPVVQQLEAAGYPVQKINVGQQQQLAQQYGVSSIPCFILVSNGKIIDRVVGATSGQRLMQMYAKAGFQPGAPSEPAIAAAPAMIEPPPAGGGRQIWPAEGKSPPPNRQARGQEPSPPAQNAALAIDSSDSNSLPPTQQAMAASVRLKIQDGSGFSYGSGTIVDRQDDESLVLTCGHIFRSSGGKGQISVDLFNERGEHIGSVDGQVIHYDLEGDVGLVAMRTKHNVQPMRVAGPGYRVDRGARVFSIGCDRGAAPSVRESRVTNINKFLGPANIEVKGAPVDGRSGGGLFAADGTLIGVCNAADLEDDEGLYAALETVHAVLTAAHLSFVYADNLAQSGPRTAPRQPADFTNDQVANGRMNRSAGAPANAAANVSMPQLMAEDTEVILIMRSKSQPQQQGQVLFIERPTRGLLDAIAAQHAHAGPQPTSHEVAAPSVNGPAIYRGQDQP